jgi:hypothetical protein
MSLNLEQGDEKLADDIDKRIEQEVKAQRKSPPRTVRKDTDKAKSTSGRRTKEQIDNDQIAAQVARTFDRIVKALEDREDEELATVIEEDKDAMSRGIVSLTRNVKQLRKPLIVVLNLIEPLLAFGRVGRILLLRFAERRARVMAEREMAAAQQAPPSTMEPQTAQPWYDGNR